MKKLIFVAAACSMIFVAGCKKETTVTETTTVNEDGSTSTVTTTTTDYDVRLRKAEEDYRRAENDVVVARERGDTEAERVARDAAAKAKTAWEATKSELKVAGAKTKEVFEDARKEIKEEFNDKDTIVVKKSK